MPALPPTPPAMPSGLPAELNPGRNRAISMSDAWPAAGEGLFDWVFQGQHDWLWSELGLDQNPAGVGTSGLVQASDPNRPATAVTTPASNNMLSSSSSSVRSHSPSSGAEWPNASKRQEETIHNNFMVGDFGLDGANSAILAAEDTCQVTPIGSAIKERLANELVPQAQVYLSPAQRETAKHAIRRSRTSVLNVFVQLYFERFDSSCPVIHRATFDPNHCDLALLGAIIATGAMYSAIPRAQQFAQMLMTLVNSALFAALPEDYRFTSNSGVDYLQGLLLK